MTSLRPRGFRRERCRRCGLVMVSCICAAIERQPFPAQLVLLQHPNEMKRASSTGSLLLHCVERAVRIQPGAMAVWSQHIETWQQVSLLFPQDGESGEERDGGVGARIPDILVVPDGTWSEARRMVRSDPWLRALPRESPPLLNRWSLPVLRKDRWNRPCTAEALGLWLEMHLGKGGADPLYKTLSAFITAGLKTRQGVLPGS